MTNRAFTDTQEREILQMRAVGIPTGDIIREFDGRKNAVYAVFHRHGVPLDNSGPTARALSPAERSTIIEMAQKGSTVSAIVAETGRSRDLVKNVLGQPTKKARLAYQCQSCGSTDVVLAPVWNGRTNGTSRGN